MGSKRCSNHVLDSRVGKIKHHFEFAALQDCGWDVELYEESLLSTKQCSTIQLEHYISSLQQGSLYFWFLILVNEPVGWIYWYHLFYLIIWKSWWCSICGRNYSKGSFFYELRCEFESTRSNLMNRKSVPYLNVYLNDLLREEQRLLTQSNMEQYKSNLVPIAYVAQNKSRGRDRNNV